MTKKVSCVTTVGFIVLCLDMDNAQTIEQMESTDSVADRLWEVSGEEFREWLISRGTEPDLAIDLAEACNVPVIEILGDGRGFFKAMSEAGVADSLFATFVEESLRKYWIPVVREDRKLWIGNTASETKGPDGPLFADGNSVDYGHVENDELWQLLARGEASPEDQMYAAGWIARLKASTGNPLGQKIPRPVGISESRTTDLNGLAENMTRAGSKQPEEQFFQGWENVKDGVRYIVVTRTRSSRHGGKKGPYDDMYHVDICDGYFMQIGGKRHPALSSVPDVTRIHVESASVAGEYARILAHQYGLPVLDLVPVD